VLSLLVISVVYTYVDDVVQLGLRLLRRVRGVAPGQAVIEPPPP